MQYNSQGQIKIMNYLQIIGEKGDNNGVLS